MDAVRAGFRWPVAVGGYRWEHHPPAELNGRIERIDSELVELDPGRGYDWIDPLGKPTALFRDLALLQPTGDPYAESEATYQADILAFAARWGPLFRSPTEGSGDGYSNGWVEHVEVLAYAVRIYNAIVDEDIDVLEDWLTGVYWLEPEHHVPWKMRAGRWPNDENEDEDEGLSRIQAIESEEDRFEAYQHWSSDEQRYARIMRSIETEQARVASWTDQEILRAARHRLLHKEIKCWLTTYSSPDIIEDDDGHGRIEQVPNCLYGAAWRQLAEAILGNRQYRQCQQCPRWFVLAPDVGRADKRYCSDACRAAAYRRRGWGEAK
jgi:hypothetical protein